MDGSTMPSAKNVAEVANSLKVDMNTAAQEIAKCFNTAIKFLCENIKLQDFAKGMEKDIDAFCSTTQNIVSKIFKSVDIVGKTLNAAIISLDSVQLPKGIVRKMKDIKRLFKKANKIIKPLVKFCLKMIAFSPLVNLASVLIIPLRNMVLRIADMYEATERAAHASKKIWRRRKFLLRAPDVIKDFLDKTNESTDFLFKMWVKMIFAKLAFKEIDAVYDWVWSISKTSVKIVLLSPFLLLGARVMNRFANILKSLIDTLTDIKVSFKLRFRVYLLKQIIEDIKEIGWKCIVFLIMAIPAFLGVLLLWGFVALLKVIINFINNIDLNKKTFGVIFGMLAIINIILLIAVIATVLIPFAIGAIIGLILGILVVLLMWAIIAIVKQIKFEWKSLLILLFMLVVAVTLLAIAIVLTILSIIASKISIEGVLNIVVALVVLLGITMALGAIMAAGGWVVILFGMAAIAMVLAITMMILVIAFLSAKISLEGLQILAEALTAILTAIKQLRRFKIGLKDILNLLIVMLSISILLIAAVVIFVISKLSEKIVIEGLKNFGEALSILLTGVKNVREFKIGLKEIKDLLIVMLAMSVLLIAAIVIFAISWISERIVISGLRNFGEGLVIMLEGMKAVTSSGLKITFKTIGQVALILVATIMLTVIGVGLMIMSKVGEKISIASLSVYGAAIGTLMATLSLLGAAGTVLIPILGAAAAVIGLMSVSILLLMGMATLLTKFDETVDYKAKADSLISFFKDMLNSINDISLITITKVMLKIMPLMMISMGLSFMAHTIASIAKLDIPDEWNEKGKPIHFRQMTDDDFKLACDNALRVLGTLVEAVSSDEVNDLTGFGLVMAMMNFHRLDIIALQLAFMTKTIASIAMLQVPDEWNENGDPIHFRQLTDTDFENAAQAAHKIMTSLIDMVTTINTDEIEEAASRAEDIFDDIEEIVDPIGQIVDIICGLATMQVPISWDSHGRPNDFKTLEPDDFVKAGESIKTIVEKFCTNLTVIGTPAIEEAADRAEDIFDDLEEIVDPIAGIVDMTIKLAKGAQIPSKWNDEGKPIEWTKIGDAEYNTAAENIATIVSKFIGMFTDEKMKAAINSKDLIKDSEDMFKSLNVAVSPIKGILDIVQGFAGGKFPTKFNAKGEGTDWVSVAELCKPDGSLSDKGLQIQNAITGLITLTFDAIKNAKLDDTEISKNANLIRALGTATKPLGNMISYYDKLDENKMKHVKEFTAENIKWLNRVDNINVDKVKTVAGMFEQMTEFSRTINGNFEKLADTINNKLITVLEELKELLGKTSEEIENHHSNVKASGTSGLLNQSGGSDKSKNNNINTPDGKKEDKKVDLSATNDAIDRVTGAINELYSLVYTQYK